MTRNLIELEGLGEVGIRRRGSYVYLGVGWVVHWQQSPPEALGYPGREAEDIFALPGGGRGVQCTLLFTAVWRRTLGLGSPRTSLGFQGFFPHMVGEGIRKTARGPGAAVERQSVRSSRDSAWR